MIGQGLGSCTTNGVVTLDCIPIIFSNLIQWTLIFAGVVALILIIIGGIKFITSGGEAKQAEGARKTITYAIVGLVLILLSFAIVRIIADATGVSCINQFGFTNCEQSNNSGQSSGGTP